MRLLVFGMLVASLVGLSVSAAGVAQAQGLDPLDEEARCGPGTLYVVDGEEVRGNPNSERCICAQVSVEVPIPQIDDQTGLPVDVNGDGVLPVRDGWIWAEGKEGLATGDGDLAWIENPYYEMDCAVSYLREDMRRAWQYAAVLAGTFLFASLAWAGVVYMQESAAGADLSRARTMMIRVVVGLIIVACAWVLWEMVGDLLLGHLQSWTGDRDVFYRVPGSGQ